MDIKVSSADGFAETKPRSDTQISSAELVKSSTINYAHYDQIGGKLNVNSTISVEPKPGSTTEEEEPKKPVTPPGFVKEFFN